MHHRPLVADAVRSLQHRRPAGATVQIDKSDSSLPFNLFDATRQNPDYHDRFTLTLVIDGVRAKWEVFFAGYEGATPPDFIFSSDPHFDPDLPSMTRWTDRPLSEALVRAAPALRACRLAVNRLNSRCIPCCLCLVSDTCCKRQLRFRSPFSTN